MSYGQSSYGGARYGGTDTAIPPTFIDLPAVNVGVTIHAPTVRIDKLEPPALIVTVTAHAPSVHEPSIPIARHARYMSIKSKGCNNGFHAALGSALYRNSIERERAVLFGASATCTLYALSPGAGESILIELRDYWTARRIPTIESGAIEQWRLEITSSLVNWEMLRNVSTVLIVPDTGEVQRYRVMQTENAMKPGHVYHLRIEAIAQI